MRQLLRILLVSFSISAVESGILYLLLKNEGKNEQAVVLTDTSLLTEDADGFHELLSESKRSYSPVINHYRRFPVNHKPAAHQPRSDGRVYRR